MVRFSADVRDFYTSTNVKTGSVSHPASYPIGTGLSFLRGVKKTAYFSLIFTLRTSGATSQFLYMISQYSDVMKHTDNSPFTT